MKDFNPAAALEKLGEIVSINEKSGLTEQLRVLNDGIAFIKKINDDAFEEGFKAGIEAHLKVDKYESN